MAIIHHLKTLERQTLPLLIAICLALLAAIGVIDYLTGFEMFFSVFYLLGVGLAAWFVGRTFGFIMSVLSVLVWVGGDLAAGAVIYFIVVMLLSHLRAAQRDLEMRVQQRSQALTREIAERERLESEILKVSEREQRRIGHELHDVLCQHLTATALAGEVLSGKLASQALPENADANKIVELVEQGINIARDLARGLYPVEMEAEGLMAAFQELATNLPKAAGIACTFQCEAPVLIHDDAVATHLFCIGQEAVRNAIQHGKPQHIGITLSERSEKVTLTAAFRRSWAADNGPPGGCYWRDFCGRTGSHRRNDRDLQLAQSGCFAGKKSWPPTSRLKGRAKSALSSWWTITLSSANG